MNCYMCNSAGSSVTAVAICHYCGVALCQEHLDEDLLGYKAYSLAGRSCRHHLHGAAMARRQTRLSVETSPEFGRNRQFSVQGNTKRLQSRHLHGLPCGRP